MRHSIVTVVLVTLLICYQVEGADETSGYASWPLPLLIGVCLFTLTSTPMFCGLTIGLLGMDTINLEIIAEAGASPDRDYARKIIPIRNLGHHLLATLLLGNMLTLVLTSQLVAAIVNSTELINFIVSTLLVLIFGEILPMSFCNNEKYGLWAGAKSLPALKISIFILYPIAKPLGMMLDCLVSHDAGQLYDREEFKKLIRVHWEKYSEKSGLDAEQLRMMLSALDAKEVTLTNIMTPIEKAFMLDGSEVLGPDLQRKLWEYGKSRVPVYVHTADNIIGVLYVRDLISVPVLSGDYTAQTVRDFIAEHPRDLLAVGAATKLTSALALLLRGNTQLLFVEQDETVAAPPALAAARSEPDSPKDTKKKGRRHSQSHGSGGEGEEDDAEEMVSARVLCAKNLLRFEEGKDVHHFVGIVTMEDVIEGIISEEIYDEDEYDLELRSDDEDSNVSVPYSAAARRARCCPRINFYSFGPPQPLMTGLPGSRTTRSGRWPTT
ncbi:hypothetical protein STCU_09730 [Strigomonas culicis]|uniref:CNNM transmembrane domain-containing protein n=1 Tax=Strigomonas culicis TaxID=28005 RepID=S9TQE7_9TRYP|nr:hypothetical protein STCU_09730 [Strigomonas culicis]|eukprot:EPY18874.1 hypothetical protein STCU_09730 [Strigomonas culicis]